MHKFADLDIPRPFVSCKFILFPRCILTYEVVYSKTGDEGTYTTVTDKNRFKFTTAFVYAPTPQNGKSFWNFAVWKFFIKFLLVQSTLDISKLKFVSNN